MSLAWLPLFAAALPVLAAPKPPPAVERKAEKQSELREVQERIEALRRDLAKSEESRTSIADQLREAESAISNANRRIRELATTRGQTQAELADIESQQRQLSHQAAAQQAQLGRLLRQQQRAGTVDGADDALQSLLAGRDPNQAARDWHYLKLLSRAKADLIKSLAVVAAEKQRLAEATREKSAEIARIEARQQEERTTLQARSRERQTTLAKIAGQIRSQRREIDTLKRDEQRLGKLIEGLAKLAEKAARAKPRASPPPGRPRQAEPRAPAPREAEPRAPAPREADTSRASGDFAALKGKLKLPVKGTIAGHFAKPRPEGGTWKGLFIRAAEGSEVRAVAAGRVAFADWLRGFGNLIIVDHGDGFLSVYGNNQSLLKQAGEESRAGEVVATAGNSGGNPESGLYFELRHRGQVFNPMPWVNPR